MSLCPICKVEREDIPRYPFYVCQSCAKRAQSPDHRPVKFFNDTSGGFGCKGVYGDTDEPYSSTECFIDGLRCWAEEARFGGIVIQQGYPPLPGIRHSGTEPFLLNGGSAGFTVLEFWQWASSDLVSNAARGVLAEYIVARALNIDIQRGTRSPWDAFDLTGPNGIKIEVKSAAYLQAWYQKSTSRITFSTRPARQWSAETNQWADVPDRYADIYIFCLLAHLDKITLNPLDLNQWKFYVASTKMLGDAIGKQGTVTVDALVNLGAIEATYGTLQAAVATLSAYMV